MEILVSEPDAPGVRLKRRRPDCVRFLADAVQSMPVERGADAMLFSKHSIRPFIYTLLEESPHATLSSN